MTCAKCECLVRLKNKLGYNLYYCGYKKYGVLKALSGLYINNEEYRKDNKTCKYYKGGQKMKNELKEMADEEKIRKCIELVWDYEENYDGDDLLNFQNKELSTYTQHESIVTTFNKYIQLEKEKCELLGIIQGKDEVIAELKESLDIMNNRESELLDQIGMMKNCFNCKNNSSKTSVFCRFYARCKNNEYWQLSKKE